MTLLHNYEKIHPTFSHFNDSKDISSALDTSSVNLYEMDCVLNDILTESDCIIDHSKTRLRLDWESIDEWSDHFEQLNSEIKKAKAKVKNCNFGLNGETTYQSNKKYFDEETNKVSNLIAGRCIGFASQFERLATNFEKRNHEIVNLYKNPNPDEMAALHEKESENWCEKNENKVILCSFIDNLPSNLNEELIRKEKRALFESFKGNPLVENHHKFHSDIKTLAVKQRQTHASANDYEDYFEYVNKLRILDEHCHNEPKAVLSNHIFLPEYNHHPQRLTELKDWVKPFVGRKANELFIPYYVLWCLKQLNETKIPCFVEQLSKWFPEDYPNETEQLKKLSNSIYTEMEHWKLDGELIPFNDLHGKLPLLKLSKKKGERLHSAISKAYGQLNSTVKGWKTR